MRTFLPISQDSTIYERYPNFNTGLDEIIEVGKIIKPLDGIGKYASGSTRILLNVDIPIQNQYPTNSLYYLQLKIANAKNVNRYQTLEVYPVSGSWVEGSGYFYQDVKNVGNGVTWNVASSLVSWSLAGADYTSSISASYQFTKVPIEDVRINITNILQPVVSGSNTLEWNGLIIKFPTADEQDTSNTGNIKFFSSNTHTIFSPRIEVLYNDQTFITGSLKSIPNGSVSIIPKNLKDAYTISEVDKVYLVVRDKFPDKRFDEAQRYKTKYYLPSSSYFRIKDQASGTVIYDFDQYSTINCDSSGSYIVLDTNALDIDRYYTIDLKIVSGQQVWFPEFDYTFKVDRNG